MHGNVEKNLDDSLPLQAMAYFFLQICSRGGFEENKHQDCQQGKDMANSH